MSTPAELAECLQDLAREYPQAVLKRNLVGNLVFYAHPDDEEATGFVELMECGWYRFADLFGVGSE